MTYTSWWLLIFTLPSQHSSARMRIWRAIKGLGCASLRDGVNLLPDSEASRSALNEIAEDIRQTGGSAWLLRLPAESERDPEFRSLFDRSAEYTALLEQISALAQQAPDGKPEALSRTLRVLRRQFELLTGIDYFPGQAAEHARLALSDLETRLAERLSPGEPSPGTRAIERLDPRDYRNRLWATRRDLWVDRVACAWLIRRHIDRKARFLWLTQPADCPIEALGFDFDTAAFSHVGQRVSFETLLVSFGLDSDPALQRLGGVIHALDAGGVMPAEAAGLAALLKGIKAASADDDDFLQRATPVFDALQTSFTEEQP